MENSSNIFKTEAEFLLPTYKRIPIEISHGDGIYLYCKDGKKYLDFFSGLAVNALGYGNQKIIQAINNQIKSYIHLSNYYIGAPQVELAKELVQYTGLSKVFFTNSGTEAIESSLKLIRKYYGPDKKIITFSNAFHGRTYGSLSLSSKVKYKKQFSPLLPNITELKFNDTEELESNINETTAAVYLEFVQGEGGIHITSASFIEKIIQLKNKYDFAILADEIQSGIGRTGKPFAYSHFELKPDLVVLAKAIGGGLPLGALVVNSKYSDVFQYGDHGTTFGGNPVACAAGLALLQEISDQKILAKVESLGKYFRLELISLKNKYSNLINEVRGLGFMIGVEMKIPCTNLIEQFRNEGILVNCTNENVLRILPPLIISKANIEYFIEVFNYLLERDVV
jgi:acetylornithine aminotransferase